MLKAVLFDLDGTLTVPCLDFARMRADVGAPPERTILEHIATLEDTDREAALRVLDGHELPASRGSELRPGAREALAHVRSCGLRTAIVTNNSREAARIVIARHSLVVDRVLTREHAPPKPEPDLLVRTLAAFGIAPREALFIGDGSLDTAAAVRADVPHALIGDDDTSPNGAEWTLASLQELPALVDKLLDSGGREGR